MRFTAILANGMNRAVKTMAAVLLARRRLAHARIPTTRGACDHFHRSTPTVRPIV